MLLLEDGRLAVRALLRTPVRSFLVLQGIAWGVGIAIFPAAVIEGSRAAAVGRAEECGTGRVSLAAEPGTRPLTVRDAASLRSGVPGFRPFRVGCFRVQAGVSAGGAGSGPAAVDVLGTDPSGAAVRDQRLDRGRYLEARDEVPGAPAACVLEPRAAEALFPGADPLGRRLRIPGAGREGAAIEAEVVGLLAPRTERALRTDDFGLEIGHRLEPLVRRMLLSLGVPPLEDGWKRSERGVHLPLSLLPREGDAVDWLLLRTLPEEAPGLADAARGALVARGASPVARANLLWPFLASGRVDHYMRLKDALVAACLAMGAVVIANVMLLSLLVRTREIAVRRAEGATRGDIAAQFLVEAGILGAAGAVLGIPLGMALGWVRLQFAPYTTMALAFPVGTVLLASGVAVAVALAAGVLPARRAAALDPAAALREP